MSPSPDTAEAALGVDGGAGRLKFAVRRPDGKVAHHHAPGANPILVGMKEFVERLKAGVDETLVLAELRPSDIRSAGFGLSGVGRAHQVDLLSAEIRARILPACRRLWVGNDAMAALRQGAGALRGTILIAGTGSICYGVDDEGRVVRVGGWGGELGDEGSGFWIGLQALQTACHMADGRVPSSSLLNVVLHELELESPEDFIPWTGRVSRERFKQQTARLFPAIASLAAGGDAESRRILDEARAYLVDHVRAATTRLAPPDRPAAPETEQTLVCAGGVFAGNESFYTGFVDRLRAVLPSVRPVRLLEPASLGALSLGCEAPELPSPGPKSGIPD